MPTKRKNRKHSLQPSKAVTTSQRYIGGGIGFGSGYDDAAFYADYYERTTIPRTDIGLASAFAISVWAYRATTVRSSMVGSIPWHIKNTDTGEIVDKSSDVKMTHPLAKAIQGVKRTQDFGLFELWEYSLCIFGEAYFEKLRTGAPLFFPAGFYWLNPVDVTPFAPFGKVESITYVGTDSGRVVQLKEDQFILSRYFNPIDITAGISPLEVALTDVNVEANAKAFAKLFFRNNARPGLIFRPKGDGDVFDDKQIKQMRRQISEQWGGVSNAGKPQILNAPVDVTTVDSQNLDDQSASTERLSRDILAAFGVPRALAGDTDSANYKTNDDVMQWFLDTTIKPECARIQDTVNIHMLPFFDNSGLYVFEFDFSGYERVTDADKARQDLNEQRLGSTAMTLYDYQKASGIDEPAEAFKHLWRVDGIIGFVPTAELPTVWKLYAPAPPVAPAPVLPADPVAPFTPPAAPTPETQRTGGELCIALDLANHPDLTALQARVMRLEGLDTGVEWNAPDSFHVTLAYAIGLDPAQRQAALDAVNAIPVPELGLGVGSLRSFDTVGSHALHFRIRQNSALRDYQAAVIEALTDSGVTGLSAYSDPARFTPHVTMGYAPEPKRVTFHSNLTVKPHGLVVWGDDNATLYRTTDAQAEADAQRHAVRCLDEFEAYATFVRNGKHQRREFTWSYIDADTAYLLKADIADAPDADKRGANIVEWREVMHARKGISPVVFVPENTPQATLDYQRTITEQTADYRAYLASHGITDYDLDTPVRNHYLSVMSRRAVSREQARFEQAALILFRRAQKDRLPKNVFEGELYDLIAESCRKALIAGYEDGGVLEHELTPRDEAWLSGHLLEQRARIADVATSIYIDGVVTDDEITGKPRMWWNLSVNPSFNEGLARASKSALGKFVRGNTLESCRDCVQYDELVFPFSVWFNFFGRQLPPCTATECGGFNCKCSIVPFVGKKSPGTPPKLHGAKRVLSFESMEALQS